MGTFYRSRHELIFIYKVGTAKHLNTFGLGETGRYRTSVWEYPGVNSFGGNLEDLALHPTVKPVTLVADALRDLTRRSDIFLYGFGGSGTTLIAAERAGRVARPIELDPLYRDVICRRLEHQTGHPARLVGADQIFLSGLRMTANPSPTPRPWRLPSHRRDDTQCRVYEPA